MRWPPGCRNGVLSTICSCRHPPPLAHHLAPPHPLKPALTHPTSASTPAPSPALIPALSPAQNPAPADSAPGSVPFPRTLRSFVRRQGRTTVGQTRALAEIGPTVLVPYAGAPTDVASLFDLPSNPLVLEIGFGMGEATAQIALSLPDTNFLCCEVHEPGVGALLKRIGESHIGNIRILAHDAVEVLDHMLAPNSLDGVHIFFPDPWHKKRHNKRRLIQSPLVAKLAARIKPGGYLHCATDWEPYAVQMLEVLGAEPLLVNSVSADSVASKGYAPKPAYRPLTKFENRGLKLGHGVWDLVFLKRP